MIYVAIDNTFFLNQNIHRNNFVISEISLYVNKYSRNCSMIKPDVIIIWITYSQENINQRRTHLDTVNVYSSNISISRLAGFLTSFMRICLILTVILQIFKPLPLARLSWFENSEWLCTFCLQEWTFYM